MRRLLPALAFPLAVVLVPFVGGCSAVSGVGRGLGLSKDTGLSFAQVQSIQPGLSAAQVRDAFGAPLNMARGSDGRVTRMEYVALDAKKSRERLVLGFDEREILVTKTYSGEILRP